MQIASPNRIYQLKCFVEQEVAFKQEAVKQYHIMNETNTADRETLEKNLEDSHSQIMYQTDLALRARLALGESEMHASQLHQEGKVQYEEFAQLLKIMMDENTSRAAGASHGQAMTVQGFADIATALGRPLEQRTTGYGRVDDGVAREVVTV